MAQLLHLWKTILQLQELVCLLKQAADMKPPVTWELLTCFVLHLIWQVFIAFAVMLTVSEIIKGLLQNKWNGKIECKGSYEVENKVQWYLVMWFSAGEMILLPGRWEVILIYNYAFLWRLELGIYSMSIFKYTHNSFYLCWSKNQFRWLIQKFYACVEYF